MRLSGRMRAAFFFLALGVFANGCRKLSEGFMNTSQGMEVRAGQTFTVSLESNPTTGYRWELGKPLDEAVVKFAGSRFIGPENSIPGAGGKEVWTFQAVSGGKTAIFLKYVRPWENDAAPRTRTIDVVVR